MLKVALFSIVQRYISLFSTTLDHTNVDTHDSMVQVGRGGSGGGDGYENRDRYRWRGF